jgi:hypothetical protein
MDIPTLMGARVKTTGHKAEKFKAERKGLPDPTTAAATAGQLSV